MDKVKLARLTEILQPMYIFHEQISDEDFILLDKAVWFFFDESEENIWRLLSKFIQIQRIVKDGGIPVAKEILVALNDYSRRLNKVIVVDATTFEDDFECKCGNTVSDSGFHPCEENGIEIEPVKDVWKYHYLCGDCRQIYLYSDDTKSEKTLEVQLVC